jgi:hypothetical protein
MDEADNVAHINSPVGEGLLDNPPATGSLIPTADLVHNSYSSQATDEAVVAPQDLTAERDLIDRG